LQLHIREGWLDQYVSGSERGRSVKPARYRSRYWSVLTLSMPYIDLQSALESHFDEAALKRKAATAIMFVAALAL